MVFKQSQLLKYLPKENLSIQVNIDSTYTGETKTLGMFWTPDVDIFTIKVNVINYRNITKRTVLSDTARLFDPLGLINPVIVRSKIFMQ